MLEHRVAPVNNVLTTFVNGMLTISTANQLWEASIRAGDNDQVFDIVGTANGKETLNKTVNTFIDGLNTKQFTSVTPSAAAYSSTRSTRTLRSITSASPC